MQRLQAMSFRRQAALALAALSVCYTLHFACCANSPLPEFSLYYRNSDMHANLLWAQSIQRQGWLNPVPHQAYNDWMRKIAPYGTWVQWWGGEAIFPRSPLYAYLLAFFLKFAPSLLLVHLFQCLFGVLLCGLLGLLAWSVFDSRAAGWITYGIAALYGPFYGYAWPLLRDQLGWLLMVASMLLIARWWRSWNETVPSRFLSAGVGVSLGVGLLAKETFYLIILASFALLLAKSLRHKHLTPFALLACFTALAISPLAIRNVAVGAPPLSSSNRFTECFIVGNAPSAHPCLPTVPKEMGAILERSQGKPWPAIRELFAAYRNRPRDFLLLQIKKTLALFDPFEAADNLSLYIIAEFSPFVRWGLPHWFVLIPGIGGFLLGIWRRDLRQLWLWVFLFMLTASLFINPIHSRFRQSLALLWIPWAGYFTASVWKIVQRKPRYELLLASAFLLIGWSLCLGPLAVHPRHAYHRPAEYRLAAFIYEQQGETDKSQELLDRCKRKTHEADGQTWP